MVKKYKELNKFLNLNVIIIHNQESLLCRMYNILRVVIRASWLAILLLSFACTAPYKGNNKYKSVPCPLEKNKRRAFHTYY